MTERKATSYLGACFDTWLTSTFSPFHTHHRLSQKLYNDAATHIYTALHLQQAEAEVEGAHLDQQQKDSSVTSGSLWETFRVALEL